VLLALLPLACRTFAFVALRSFLDKRPCPDLILTSASYILPPPSSSCAWPTDEAPSAGPRACATQYPTHSLCRTRYRSPPFVEDRSQCMRIFIFHVHHERRLTSMTPFRALYTRCHHVPPLPLSPSSSLHSRAIGTSPSRPRRHPTARRREHSDSRVFVCPVTAAMGLQTAQNPPGLFSPDQIDTNRTQQQGMPRRNANRILRDRLFHFDLLDVCHRSPVSAARLSGRPSRVHLRFLWRRACTCL
jgi:hypothetical protein